MTGRRARRTQAALARVAAALLVIAAPACSREREQEARTMTGGGEPARGRGLIRSYGCSSCHVIPGVAGATATVGPTLEQLLQRASVAGDLPNTPDNLVSWIQHPQRHRPGTLMPEMNVTESDARDIAAYLYSVR